MQQTLKTLKTISPPNKASRRGSPAAGPDLVGFPNTDVGNAQRLMAAFGCQIRYCPEEGRWLIRHNKRWRADKGGQIRRRARQALRVFHAQALRISDRALRKAAEVHANKSKRASAITALLRCAESHPAVAASISIPKGPTLSAGFGRQQC
jgi:hypothetical protein